MVFYMFLFLYLDRYVRQNITKGGEHAAHCSQPRRTLALTLREFTSRLV